ncbi:type II toxin-antitoxin system RelE/ParE family toxin [Pararobbsia silviterrae]|uniref:Type II toxin-antitoxin system RelE/ParE family toxin n=2 Tax=Pararobbsia silviterrae TaxID=1792498 RepID=A0A494XUQ7_9BURK|nr:type II toxin-antitoxin system RelE/ParE family toxin [Pararobbsia silviterrae]RKP53441.1 type II toxin-antitoxin system RelE/ParE family toxin [Pararobbsia silviterrae]
MRNDSTDFPPIAFHQTDAFARWLDALRDPIGKAKILIRIKRAEAGNFGDSEPVGEGISEMRVDFGPGYRIYYAQRGRKIYLLICGGDKSTQTADIRRAKALWNELKDDA